MGTKYGKPKVVGMLPARLDSTRLPGKALIDIRGVPAIVHTYKRCCMAERLDEVYVVTNSPKIRDVVNDHGGKVIMTGEHPNGTERIHEASQSLDGDIYVLVNGDEVLVYPDHIDAIVSSLLANSGVEYTLGVTPYSKINSPQDFKVVIDRNNDMIYCSREDIPSSAISGNDNRLKAVFIVGFTRESLRQFVNMPCYELEDREPNEFFRILYNAHKIRTVRVDGARTSLDTEADLEEIINMMKTDELFPRYRHLAAST